MDIILQIVELMVNAEERNMHHCRLNFNSILIEKENLQPKNNQLMKKIKVCDWGYGP